MTEKAKDRSKDEYTAEQPNVIDSKDEMRTEEKTESKHQEEKRFSRKSKKENPAEKLVELQELLNQKDDQYLRLHADFDNYRKRTLREKMELTKTAGEAILVNILPVIDDFERALQSIEAVGDVEAIKEGILLIYKRFSDYMKQNGVVEIEAKGEVFDTDLHEAIVKIPAPTEELKGKVVDVIQKGYKLNDKIIRFAKVVIGE